MKKVDGRAVRLADATDGALAGVPAELAVTLVDIAGACREGLMAVAVEAGLATALAIMTDEAARLCGPWNARDAERDCERGGTTATSVVRWAASGSRSAVPACIRSPTAAALGRCPLRRSACSRRVTC